MIQRSIAILKIGAGKPAYLEQFSNSDQIRILATAATAHSERNLTEAKALLTKALDLAQAGLAATDPALRALAITGNNLACTIQEKSNRSPIESDLMLLAARTSRKYWERAGTWLEISRAEYRLAMTYLQLQDPNQAFQHAQNCLLLCQENKAEALDLFYAYEALALVEKAKGHAIAFNKAVDQAKH